MSGFDVPEYAVFADRVRRKTGLSFVRAFHTEQDGFWRDFAVTVEFGEIPRTPGQKYTYFVPQPGA